MIPAPDFDFRFFLEDSEQDLVRRVGHALFGTPGGQLGPDHLLDTLQNVICFSDLVGISGLRAGRDGCEEYG